MKKTLLLSIILVLIISAFGQDIIYIKKGGIYEAKVIEISVSEIKYREHLFPEGPIMVVKASKVNKIVFENGNEKIISGGPKGNDINLGRSILSYHMFDVVYNEITFTFERINKSKKMGFKIPLSIGFNPDYSGPRDYGSLFYSGFGLNLYPANHRTWTYFLGPELQIGLAEDRLYISGYPDKPSYYKTYEFVFGKLLVNNGVHYSPSEHLCLTTIVGVGLRYYDNPDQYNNGLRSTFNFTVMLAYRF